MDIKETIHLVISPLLIYACYTDVMHRRISNRVSLTVMALSLILMFVYREWGVLLLAAGVLFVGFFISLFSVIGAGDVKLICALLPGLSWADGIDFLLLTGFVGIPVSLATLLYFKLQRRGQQITVPYGLAIAGGYGLQLFLH